MNEVAVAIEVPVDRISNKLGRWVQAQEEVNKLCPESLVLVSINDRGSLVIQPDYVAVSEGKRVPTIRIGSLSFSLEEIERLQSWLAELLRS